MQLGGPVWHASAAPFGGVHLGSDALRAAALLALKGVGDAERGQWEEWTGRAYHVRRRLTAAKQQSVGDVVDIRGTDEAKRRHAAAQRRVPMLALPEF